MSKMRKEYDPNKVKRRKRKPIVYIICEGKETETLYFKHFRSRNCLVDIIPISSKKKSKMQLIQLISTAIPIRLRKRLLRLLRIITESIQNM